MRKKGLVMKGISVILGTLMLTTLFTACSGGGTSKSSVKTITLYLTNAPDVSGMSKIIPAFEKANKDIKVNCIETPFDQFDSKLQTMIASNTQPDITTHFGWSGFADFASKGQLLDLTPYMESTGFDAAKIGIPDSAMKTWQIDGKQYGIPFNIYVSLMLYNKDMFDKAGIPYPPSDYEDTSWTWDKMVQDAQKLTKISSNIANTQYGLIWNWNGGGGYEQDPEYFGDSIFPASTFTDGGYATQNNFGSTAAINDFQKLADLTFKLKVSPTQAFTNGMGGNDPFYAGKIGMEVGGAWILAGINDVKFKVGVAAIPVGGNSKVRDVLWTNPLWILKGSKNPAAAFDFIDYMVQTSTQLQEISDTTGDPPANLNALSGYENYFKGVDSKDIANIFNGGIEYGDEGYSHLMVGSNQLHTVINNEMGLVFNQGKSAASVCPKLQSELNTQLQKIAATK